MKGPLTKPTLKLSGEDGNAFAIMGRVKQALRQSAPIGNISTNI